MTILNLKLFYLLNSMALFSSLSDSIIIFCADILPWAVVTCAFVFFFYHKIERHDYANPFEPLIILKKKVVEMIFILSSAGVTFFVSEILKSIFQTPRPFLLLQDINVLAVHGGLDSFPSSHASFFGALALAIFMIHRRAGVIFIILALIIGVARIVSGVHFPFDILGGYLLAFIVSLSLYKVFYGSNKAN